MRKSNICSSRNLKITVIFLSNLVYTCVYSLEFVFVFCILYIFLRAFHLFTRTLKKTLILILKQKISFAVCVRNNQSFKIENLIYSYCFRLLENNNKYSTKLFETLNDRKKKTNYFKKIKIMDEI